MASNQSGATGGVPNCPQCGRFCLDLTDAGGAGAAVEACRSCGYNGMADGPDTDGGIPLCDVYPQTAADVEHWLGVHTWLVPFAGNYHDVIAIGNGIADVREEMCPTARSFKRDRVIRALGTADRDAAMSFDVPQRLWAAHHTQPVGPESGAHHRYTNPEYVHYESVGLPHPPVYGITEWVRAYAAVGHTDAAAAERLLGIDSVDDHVDDWDHRRARGRTRVANSIAVTRDWTAWTVPEIARAYGMDSGLARTYLDTYRTVEDTLCDPTRDYQFLSTSAGRRPDPNARRVWVRDSPYPIDAVAGVDDGE